MVLDFESDSVLNYRRDRFLVGLSSESLLGAEGEEKKLMRTCEARIGQELTFSSESSVRTGMSEKNHITASIENLSNNNCVKFTLVITFSSFPTLDSLLSLGQN
jgi:hypothetical protein